MFQHTLNGLKHGIVADNIRLDFSKVQTRKGDVVKKLAKGVEFLLKKNKVDTFQGLGRLAGRDRVEVRKPDGGTVTLQAKNIMLATGSVPRGLPGLEFDGERVLHSDHVLELQEVPKSMLILGAGAVGVEFASAFGRFGSKIVLVEMLERIVPLEDADSSKELERSLKIQFKKMMVPDGVTICERQLLNLIHRVHEVQVDEQAIAPFMSVMEEEFAGMNREEVMKRFASLEFNRFLEYYRFAEDLNVYEGRETRERAGRKANMDLLFINLGKMDHLSPKDLLNMFCQVGKLKPHQIGDIRLKGAYSFVEVPGQSTQQIVRSFNGFIYKGRRVRVEIRSAMDEGFTEKPRAHKGSSREMPKEKKKSTQPYKGRKW